MLLLGARGKVMNPQDSADARLAYGYQRTLSMCLLHWGFDMHDYTALPELACPAWLPWLSWQAPLEQSGSPTAPLVSGDSVCNAKCSRRGPDSLCVRFWQDLFVCSACEWAVSGLVGRFVPFLVMLRLIQMVLMMNRMRFSHAPLQSTRCALQWLQKYYKIICIKKTQTHTV